MQAFAPSRVSAEVAEDKAHLSALQTVSPTDLITHLHFILLPAITLKSVITSHLISSLERLFDLLQLIQQLLHLMHVQLQIYPFFSLG